MCVSVRPSIARRRSGKGATLSRESPRSLRRRGTLRRRCHRSHVPTRDVQNGLGMKPDCTGRSGGVLAPRASVGRTGTSRRHRSAPPRRRATTHLPGAHRRSRYRGHTIVTASEHLAPSRTHRAPHRGRRERRPLRGRCWRCCAGAARDDRAPPFQRARIAARGASCTAVQRAAPARREGERHAASSSARR